MIKATEIRNGIAIKYEDEVFIIVNFQHVAKGNKRSYMQVTMRNMKTSQLIDVRFRAADSVDEVFIDKKNMEYLYSQGEEHILMDIESFEQITIGNDIMGNSINYLKPNTEIEAVLYEGNIVSIEIPQTVDLKVVDAPPVVKGATATNQSKDATMETGIKVKVPPFIETGEMIKVDTRSGEYIERVK